MKRFKNESGSAVTTFVLIMIPVILMIASFVIDFGVAYTTRDTISKSAQRAAQAGIRELYPSGKIKFLGPNSGSDKAIKDEYAAQIKVNTASFCADRAQKGLPKIDIQYGKMNGSNPPQTLSRTVGGMYDYVQVTVTDCYKPLFGSSLFKASNEVVVTRSARVYLGK